VSKNPKDKNGLTERQKEVMRCAARGFSKKQIGKELGISAFTVGDHLKRIYKTCIIHSRAELALEAQRIGLLNGGRE
jgi:DNA-binding NarL/FixJ family response regulator